MKNVDLHIHTSLSDGKYNPIQLIEIAREMKMEVISITDHDTVKGVIEGTMEGKKKQIEVIPGIEMTVEYKSEMHILGYCIDIENAELMKYIQMNEEIKRIEITRAIVNLKHKGVLLDVRSIKEKFGRVSVDSMLNEMIELGYIPNKQEGFNKYFGRGKIAYIKGVRLEPVQAIRLIKKAGGVSVLAHLNRISKNMNVLECIVTELRSAGLDGLECYYPSYDIKMQNALLSMAKKEKMVVTGGSDYHGYSNRSIGCGTDGKKIPAYVVDSLRKRNKQFGDMPRAD